MRRGAGQAGQTRVVAHFDLDCFYVQVEQRRRPELKGRPTAVVQYNPWQGGGLIAVGYEARRMGVTRSMRGNEARDKCPEVALVQVPVAHGKADLTIYRNAGSEVVAILQRAGKCERASIDEAYVDLTTAAAARLKEGLVVENLPAEVLRTHVLGLNMNCAENSDDAVREWLVQGADDSEQLLACGAIIAAELRMAIQAETGFTCSAGIAHNKMLAKLASGLHKPSQQTAVLEAAVPGLLSALPIHKMKSLGGQRGKRVKAELGVIHVGDLLEHSLARLQDLLGPSMGEWLWKAVRGQDSSSVQDRVLPKSHSSSKTFAGSTMLRSLPSVEHWLRELAEELQERLDEDYSNHGRSARLLTAGASFLLGQGNAQQSRASSRSLPLREGVQNIVHDALAAITRLLEEMGGADSISQWGITLLTLGASNIVAPPAGNASIRQFLCPVSFESNQNSETYRSEAALGSNSENETLHSKVESVTLPGNVAGEEASRIQEAFEDDDVKPTGNHPSVVAAASHDEREACTAAVLPDGASMATAEVCDRPCEGESLAHTAARKIAGGGGGGGSLQRLWEKQNLQRRNEQEGSSKGRAGDCGYNVEDIDGSVWSQLPHEIQQELRGALRHTPKHKRGRVDKSISTFFKPC